MTVPADDFTRRLTAVAADAEKALESLLADAPLAGEIARPPRLMASMRHAALGGGKRLRPFLVVESAALAGVSGRGPLLAGCALECLHC
jgi:farnesyl diphosphate synthase